MAPFHEDLFSSNDRRSGHRGGGAIGSPRRAEPHPVMEKRAAKSMAREGRRSVLEITASPLPRG
ncbi:MAG: hypothetical protein MPW16_19425 [Candidatus Manganitrophus sp.]|nr:MAG: hypothetical protein MPW16_19425 [Candidatus Manganitrophus sp.]